MIGIISTVVFGNLLALAFVWDAKQKKKPTADSWFTVGQFRKTAYYYQKRVLVEGSDFEYNIILQQNELGDRRSYVVAGKIHGDCSHLGDNTDDYLLIIKPWIEKTLSLEDVIRLSGDRFKVVGVNYNKLTQDELKEKVQNRINNLNLNEGN